MKLIGIVLLLLVGLSGSKDVLGKKRAQPNRDCYGFENLGRDRSSTFSGINICLCFDPKGDLRLLRSSSYGRARGYR